MISRFFKNDRWVTARFCDALHQDRLQENSSIESYSMLRNTTGNRMIFRSHVASQPGLQLYPFLVLTLCRKARRTRAKVVGWLKEIRYRVSLDAMN